MSGRSELACVRVVEHEAAARCDDKAATRYEFANEVSFEASKGCFAVSRKNLGDRAVAGSMRASVSTNS